MKTKSRLRCCGVYGDWSGSTWRCSRCHRDLNSDAPAHPQDKALAGAEKMLAKLRPWTDADRTLARGCFPHVEIENNQQEQAA